VSATRESPVGECEVCHLPAPGMAWRCERCAKLYKRGEVRKKPDGTRWGIDKRARLATMKKQWKDGAFRCAYTDLRLTEDFGPLHATWEHKNPGDPSSVVLVAWLINDMKTDLSHNDFKKMVRALASHFDEARPFNPNALPKSWWRVRRPPPPATPPPPAP